MCVCVCVCVCTVCGRALVLYSLLTCVRLLSGGREDGKEGGGGIEEQEER